MGVSSVLPLYEWSGPDEEDRQVAVRYLRYAIEVTTGEGEADLDEFFSGLESIGFDGIVTTCVFAREERARESSTFMREKIGEYLGKWSSAPTFEPA